ncbi:hypothetical protein ACHAAC_01745 [Aeromicrobium sp. CF4.19]|uniref:hypothetical protein n=1 Tax=Aeromicrobium sp. CF4.19 TaxID=3373082 RepID=UPI003EE78397
MDVALGFIVGLIVAGVAGLIWRRTRAVEPVPVDETDELAQMLADVAVTLLATAVDAPGLSVGERLTLVDDLRSRDLVDAEQHAAARQQVLGQGET